MDPREERLRALLYPRSTIDLAFAASLLNALSIPFIVRNENFGALRIGPVIDLYNRRWIELVGEVDGSALAALIAMAPAPTPVEAPSGPAQRVRVVVELLLAGWFMPGRLSGFRPLRAFALSGIAAALAIAATLLASIPLLLVAGWWEGLMDQALRSR